MLELILLISVLLLDQVTKAVAASWLTTLPQATYPLIPDVFHLTYVENRGAAFGMLQNARWFFIVVTVLACAAIVYWGLKNRSRLHTLMRVSLTLILAGALGNLIDRLFLVYVRDMFSFVLINFAVFNVADSAVSVGTVLLVLDVLFFKGKSLLEDTPKPVAALPEEESAEAEPCENEKDNAEEGH